VSASALLALRQRIAAVTAPAPAPDHVDGLSTGIAAIDRALAGGFPRGRLTEITGPLGSGKTSFIRQIVTAANQRVAYVDAARTLVPRDWAHVSALWVVRPPARERGAWSADVLLRSGAFGLVVLDGAPPLSRAVTMRLMQLARESDAVVLLLGEEHGLQTGAAVRLRVQSWRVTVEKGGRLETAEVPRELGVARRLCTHPEVPDRRGVARAKGRGRSPRCAESPPLG
jgi:hypothetical protein